VRRLVAAPVDQAASGQFGQTKPLMAPTTTSVRWRMLRYVCVFAGPACSDSVYLAEPADSSPCSIRVGAK
jgi:hypothetical protein